VRRVCVYAELSAAGEATSVSPLATHLTLQLPCPAPTPPAAPQIKQVLMHSFGFKDNVYCHLASSLCAGFIAVSGLGLSGPGGWVGLLLGRHRRLGQRAAAYGVHWRCAGMAACCSAWH